ncbi:MAG: pyrimidine utilization protein D [Kiloniellaceae bacterium]
MAHLTLSDGDSLYYEVHGQGPALLLVSGLNGVASFWADHVPALAERFTVVLHDHRGTGRSSRSRIAYSVDQMAGDVIQLMDGLALERAHLVGHSTGGAIGQTLALDRPERIDRLVLSATWTAADAYFRRLFEVRGEILRASGPGAYIRANALFMRPPSWTRDREAEIEAEEAAGAGGFPPPEVMLSRITAILRFDRRADLPRIAAPTLVIGARDDIVTPAYYSEELGRLIPRAETVILPQGGHFFPVTAPEDFRRIVLGFLARPGQDARAAQ